MDLFKTIILPFIIFFIIALLSISVLASDYSIVTGHLPPWSMQPGKSVQDETIEKIGGRGIHYDIVQEIERRLNSNKEFKYMPWKRSLETAGKRDNFLIFPLTYTKDREKRFNYIIEVMPAKICFASVDKIITKQEAKNSEMVLCANGAPPNRILVKEGFENLHLLVNAPEVALKMLCSGRGDAWFSNKDVLMFSALTTIGEKDRRRVRYSEPIKETTSHIATSKNFPEEITKEYQRIYKNLVDEGFVQKVMERYLGK